MQEESKIKKPKWGKPKLIVITRGDRQERVLLDCKRGFASGDDGAKATNAGCFKAAGATCAECRVIGST